MGSSNARRIEGPAAENSTTNRRGLIAILLLETTVIIDVVTGKKGRNQLLDTLLAERNLLACCSINVTEVFAGIRPHEVDPAVSFLRSLRFYDVSWEIARLAGDLQRHWRKKGRTLRFRMLLSLPSPC